MKILTDLHCHTIASDHAYSTVTENIKYASEIGMEAIAVTDHCPALGDAPHQFYYDSLHILPRELYGVRLLIGCEANILDINGTLDMKPETLSKLDIVIASIHNPFYKDVDSPDNTNAYIKVLENPYVDILGHSGNPRCRYDIEAVLRKAKELHKFVEINNNTFNVRKQNIDICREIALKAKEIGTGIVVNSDAHFFTHIGEFDHAVQMLKEIDFPEELIVNRSLETLEQAVAPRKKFR
ncbi:MAG: phosphatase [Clostridia bacterium]|nr:phosphatase [Clostridia bacterium]